jgi:hypothetical protein
MSVRVLLDLSPGFLTNRQAAGCSAPLAVGATSGARASPQTEDAPSAQASLAAPSYASTDADT